MNKINGVNSFEKKKINVWHSDMASGGWKIVTQLSQITEVRNTGRGRGCWEISGLG